MSEAAGEDMTISEWMGILSRFSILKFKEGACGTWRLCCPLARGALTFIAARYAQTLTDNHTDALIWQFLWL